MALLLQIHPDNPQERLIKQAVEIIKRGGLVVYPRIQPMPWAAT